MRSALVLPHASMISTAITTIRRPQASSRRTPTRPLCVLMSGGIESYAMLQWARVRRWQPIPLYIRCGFRWEPAEQYWLARLLRQVRTQEPSLPTLETLDVPLRSLYGPHWSFQGHVPGRSSPDRAVYLPGRNLLFLAQASVWCALRRYSAIALGTLRGNPFHDTGAAFLRVQARASRLAMHHPITILTPFRHFTKSRIVRQYGDQGLTLTFSCLRPSGRIHCGGCNKCAERQRAFRQAGLPDPTRYALT